MLFPAGARVWIRLAAKASTESPVAGVFFWGTPGSGRRDRDQGGNACPLGHVRQRAPLSGQKEDRYARQDQNL